MSNSTFTRTVRLAINKVAWQMLRDRRITPVQYLTRIERANAMGEVAQYRLLRRR